jgi:aryl-alcohol dehydrogenase-like predicted oxidoreductase
MPLLWFDVMGVEERIVVEYRRLGRSGLKVSEICLGTMTFGNGADEAGSARMVHAAFDAGVNFFDTADAYVSGVSESMLGKALKGRRSDAIIASKVFNPMGGRPNDSGMSRLHIKQAVEESLRRLQTDYIDLYQLHGFDAATPADEVLSTLHDLVRAGKIRYIGCSNFSGWHLMKALAVSERYGWSRFVAHQAYYSLIGRDYEWELMPLALDQKVSAVVWSPLGWGRLTGKIRRGQPLPETSRLHTKVVIDNGPPVGDEYLYRVVDALDAIARDTGKTVPQIAINWLLQRPTVANVIIGARNETQLRQNIAATGWSLTPDQVAALDAASDVTPAYPYWHQRGFAERNPPAV